MNVSDYSAALLKGDFKEACKIEQESIPPKLYKYFPLGVSEEKDHEILNTLKADELWFSPISGFNDPYEYMGLFIKEERLKQAGYDDAMIAAVNKTLTTISGQGLFAVSRLQTVALRQCGPTTQTGQKVFASNTTSSTVAP